MAEHKFLMLIHLIFGILIVSSLIFFKYRQIPGKTYIVTFTKNGFIPNKLYIKSYDKVIFKTNTKKPYWPASDLHPTHEIYSEFDPLIPVDSDKTWSFIFKKVGSWRFHNHLDPWARGIIIVTKS